MKGGRERRKGSIIKSQDIVSIWEGRQNIKLKVSIAKEGAAEIYLFLFFNLSTHYIDIFSL